MVDLGQEKVDTFHLFLFYISIKANKKHLSKSEFSRGVVENFLESLICFARIF